MNHAVVLQGAPSNEKVLRLDVAEDDVFGMDVLEPGDELDGRHADCLEGEAAVARFEQVLEAGTEELHHHGVVFPTCAEVVDLGHTH